MQRVQRRRVLKSAAGLLLGSGATRPAGAQRAGDRTGLPDKPNFLIILTDQERYPAHWPAGLRDRLMPSWARLARHGLTFTRAYTSASECSPSRACLLTGQYSKINGVPKLPANGMPPLPGLPNIASVLSAAGYDVYWKGKWHLGFPVGFQGGPPSNEAWSEADITAMQANYGMRAWNPPDAGNAAGAYTPSAKDDPKARAADLATAGGGRPNNDGRIFSGNTANASSVASYGESTRDLMARMARTPRERRRPFALFLSLVNPHDITFFPNGWQDIGYTEQMLRGLGVSLPANANDDLSTKPSIQSIFRDAVDSKTPLEGQSDTSLNYVNFYAYLHAAVEPFIQAALDTLEEFDLARDTVIVRTSDHGEMGLSHGLREKAYAAYEEMIHVPLVISNPVLFPEPAVTEALYSHVDLLPTLAELAHAQPAGVGMSMVPAMLDPQFKGQNEVLFTFDDAFLLGDLPGSHIRAIRDRRYTYAVYFTPNMSGFEYELYDNLTDPGQLTNLVHRASPGITDTWRALHRRLSEKMTRTTAPPPSTTFPADPI